MMIDRLDFNPNICDASYPISNAFDDNDRLVSISIRDDTSSLDRDLQTGLVSISKTHESSVCRCHSNQQLMFVFYVYNYHKVYHKILKLYIKLLDKYNQIAASTWVCQKKYIGKTRG